MTGFYCFSKVSTLAFNGQFVIHSGVLLLSYLLFIIILSFSSSIYILEMFHPEELRERGILMANVKINNFFCRFNIIFHISDYIMDCAILTLCAPNDLFNQDTDLTSFSTVLFILNA